MGFKDWLSLDFSKHGKHKHAAAVDRADRIGRSDIAVPPPAPPSAPGHSHGHGHPQAEERYRSRRQSYCHAPPSTAAAWASASASSSAPSRHSLIDYPVGYPSDAYQAQSRTRTSPSPQLQQHQRHQRQQEQYAYWGEPSHGPTRASGSLGYPPPPPPPAQPPLRRDRRQLRSDDGRSQAQAPAQAPRPQQQRRTRATSLAATPSDWSPGPQERHSYSHSQSRGPAARRDIQERDRPDPSNRHALRQSYQSYQAYEAPPSPSVSASPSPSALSSSAHYLPRRSSGQFSTHRDSALDLTDIQEEGEPIVVGGIDSAMAMQLQRPPPPEQGPTMTTTADLASSTLSSDAQPPRNGILDTIRFSWLGRSQSSGASSLGAVDAQSTTLPEDVGVVMHGWLEKCGQQFKTWNWRFFVLRKDGVLAYYSDQHMKKLKGSINVGYNAKADISVQSNMIEKKFVFMIATEHRNMMISAPSQKVMTKWIAKLHAAGATPTEPWDPSKKTVKFFVRDSECPHEWKRYDDPTSYIHMEGCLLKRGHVNKNWKNRFFRIERGELRYYTENQEQLKGSVPLKATIVSPGMTQCPDGRKNYFVLTSKDGKFEMHLNAPNEQAMHHWIEALQEAQAALGNRNAKGTVGGLALVIKRAEEIPLAKMDVSYGSREEITVELERRMESLIVSSCPSGDVPVGSQLIAVSGRSILRETYAAAHKALRATQFPLQLQLVLPPYKKGELIKKSRSGFENWKKRVIVVANGQIHYYKQVAKAKAKAKASLKHRKSFALTGCYLNLIQMPAREFCIVVARSPSDKLVLQTRTDEERVEWASVIYCSIRMVSQGMTPGHIANLGLEVAREDPNPAIPLELQSSYRLVTELEY